MRYELKDYQSDAVGAVLANLKKAARGWREDHSLSAFSLTATTGAGKTVMAAAVIEALFVGDAINDFAADLGAVVLWFTDDPALNEQTRFRLMAASDRLGSGRLVVIENTFNQEKLAPGTVYFLNAQKLSKKSLLVRGAVNAEADDAQHAFANMPPPDNRANTMWDILRNTIEDPQRTLYLILDEAHRGMKADRERATIVQRLINGENGAPAVPVVFGISATVERFDKAMNKQQGRTTYPAVVVDPARVQDSGLLKDDIRLDFPTESGAFDMALLARATRKLQDSTDRWREYAASEGHAGDAVVPLMVVQVPNKTTEGTLGTAVRTIRDAWPEITDDAFANVFGEHQDLELPGGAKVPYMEPQHVQERKYVRVLFAKDAISTGWDCPRAEVLVSFRPATDATYITQLVGRMVRTPLARRVPGNDLLNSVACVLPLFNQETAKQVAQAMTGDRSDDTDGSGGGDGRRTLFAPVDMKPNPAISDAVWAAFDQLPSQTLPRKAARPIGRYVALAQALSRDGLRANAIKEAYVKLCRKLDGFCAQYPDELKTAESDVQQVDGATIAVSVHYGTQTDMGSFAEAADDRAIEAEYQTAGRQLTRELARRYAEHIADPTDADALLDAHIRVAAIGKMAVEPSAADALDAEADQLATKWFADYRVQVKGLSDERQAAYNAIKSMAPTPQRIDIHRPRIRTEESQDVNGALLPTRSKHLMADEQGNFPVGALNAWEMQVLEKEMARDDFIAWYRNPARASPDALAVAWTDNAGDWRRMCPDFVFFHGSETDVKAAIVDPHGIHLGDALPKLKGLATFAEKYGSELHRIEAVAEVNGVLRVLDLKEAAVRTAVNQAGDVSKLYSSAAGADYV